MNDDLFSNCALPFNDRARMALTRARLAPSGERLLRARHAHWFAMQALREALRARNRNAILCAARTLGSVYCLLADFEEIDPCAECFGPGAVQDENTSDK